jgi:hypothetical protein
MINYQKWPNNTQAFQLEAALAESLLDACKLSPVAREKHYEQLFQQFRDAIGDQQNNDTPVVLTNINPYRVLFEQGEFKALLKLQKDSLPLSGDGYVQTGPIKRPKGKQYYLRDYYLPTVAHSVCHHGHASLLLNIKQIRELETYLKCYCSSAYNSAHAKDSDFLSDQLNKLIRDPEFSFKNLESWINRVINIDDVITVLMEKVGIKTNLEPWSISDPDAAKEHVEHILTMLSLNTCKHTAFYQLMRVDGDITQGDIFFPRLAKSVKYQCEQLHNYYPELTKHLLGNAVVLASECNFFDGNFAFREELRSVFKDVDFRDHTHHSKAKTLMHYLDKPELIMAMSKKGKREQLVSDFEL